MRPIDIARKLKISTSALRNYEDLGIVPPTERSSSGYRIYTKEHVAYFECIQAMSPGFGMKVASEVLRKIQSKEVNAALWMVNEVQANLHRDKTIMEKTIQILETQQLPLPDSSQTETWLTIGEVSAETGIPCSAIRHWDKIGLITSSRDQRNGYRLFNRSQIRKILLLRTFRSTVYSLDVVELKKNIAEMDHTDVEHAIRIAKDSLNYLNKINQLQLRGGKYLYDLCRSLNLLN
ncbi:MerR family DNA-binding transcriptional regulator [Paenibacillus sp. SYP-B3998]|uniref:MerR family DNA-binding transcriptional regulator n=1 Tax=Paenibacillus sp. SYP-B3998 TaxID=2678564 RepID=UPI001968405F|nr:MerR family DNA-binding transcriptional regulator [Paenibacillus sp. SYP-B3998]